MGQRVEKRQIRCGKVGNGREGGERESEILVGVGMGDMFVTDRQTQ